MKNLYYEKREKQIKNKYLKETLLSNQTKLLNNLFNSKNHYGFSLKSSNVDSFPFLYGIRSNQCIINLNKTVQTLNQCFKLINYHLVNKNKILFVINENMFLNFKDEFEILTKKNQIHIITQKSKIGLLTRFSAENIKSYNLIVLFSSNINQILLNEAKIKGIPTISLVDTNQNLSNITFPIFSNTTNIKSKFFLLYLFKLFFNKNLKIS